MAATNKHLEKAERLLTKGKLEAAVEELLLARKEEPGNDAIVLTLADTYHHLQRPRDYRQCYASLFDKYAEKADTVKAIDFFHELQKLGPVEPKRLIVCAQLLEKQKSKEAVEYYTHALEALGGQDPEASLQCLQGLTAFQPSSLELQQRLGDLAAKTGKTALAASAYGKIGELLTAEKKYEEAVEPLEKAYHLSGENAAARHSLARACSQAKRFPRVLELLAKEEEQSEDPQVLRLTAEAYFAEKQFSKAEVVYWKLSKTSPDAFNPLIEIAMETLRQGKIALALPMLQKLEQQLSAAKQQKGLISLAEKLGRIEHADIAVLEFLSHLSDKLHLDHPLATALHSLFDHYFAAKEFHKATEALERLIDVDPYAPDCSARLQKLEGKADLAIWKDLAARLGKTSTAAEASFGATSSPAAESPGREPAAAGGENTLGDLILQAEIFLQYKLQDKARERLERITKLFPGEEEKNEELRGLFARANFLPHSAPPSAILAPVRAAEPQADWGRISEIIRNLSRQSTVKGVLSVAVNDIGRLWQPSRCVVGLATPKRPPSIALEYISPGVKPSEAALLGKLVMDLQQITEEQSAVLVAEKVSELPQLTPLKESLAALDVASLVAIPLQENGQPSGILVLEQCGSERNWKLQDLAALEALAEQIVFAVSNARLRSLMKTLAVTDERSGLLHRESYLTCLLSEAERMRAQKTPLTVAILQFRGENQHPSGPRDEVLEEFLQQFGSAFASHLRQTDIPLKYGARSFAVILPATGGKEAVFMVDKMRKLAVTFSSSAAGGPPTMVAGVAEAVREAGMDSVDIVTELINRVEGALEEALKAGSSATKVLAAPVLAR